MSVGKVRLWGEMIAMREKVKGKRTNNKDTEFKKESTDDKDT